MELTRSRPIEKLIIAVASLAAIFIFQGSANAAIVTQGGNQIAISDNLTQTTEVNDIEITISSGYATITDYSAPITSEVGCSNLSTNVAICSIPAEPQDTSLHFINVSLGSGNDKFRGISSDIIIPRMVHIQGGGGDDNLSSGSAQVSGPDSHTIIIYGNEGSDILTGNIYHDELFGGYGSDIISGMGGNDTLIGNLSGLTSLDNDILYGGDGNDELLVDGGVDYAYGEEGDDYLSSWLDPVNNDTDFLYGGNGSDYFDIKPGVAKLTIDGGNGSDWVTLSYSNNTLTPDFSGGAGYDSITYFSTFLSDLTITLDNTANDGITGDTGNIHSDVEVITGGSGNDSITGGSGNDLLLGSDGNDTLSGGSGTDSFSGGNGDDLIITNDLIPEDSISCGDGNDAARVDLIEYIQLNLSPTHGCEALSLL